MRYLHFFKFSIASFLAAFLLFAYSLLTMSHYHSFPGLHIKHAFIELFSVAIITGLLLDVLSYVFRETWYKDFQFMISLALWSVVVCLLCIFRSGGGHGLPIEWAIIFRIPGIIVGWITDKDYPGFILWTLFSFAQGAIIGFVIDFLRR